LSILKNRFIPSFEGKTIEGEALQAPFPLPWYPDEFGWHVPSSRTNVRKCEEFQEFHKFLVGETDVGNVSRQEAVSMVPPLLLGVQPHHYVLDMCAAPGSKTNQLIEALHSEDLNRTKGDDLDDLEAHLAVNVPKGLIIANDANQKRSYTLVHNTKRLKSPCLMVTNHEAQLFPNINLQSEVI
jgi:16S rRNA C967 or C1407 C5-methylase (RsmB/RsmF family)